MDNVDSHTPRYLELFLHMYVAPVHVSRTTYRKVVFQGSQLFLCSCWADCPWGPRSESILSEEAHQWFSFLFFSRRKEKGNERVEKRENENLSKSKTC